MFYLWHLIINCFILFQLGHASHFRGGTISWKPIHGFTIEFKYKMGWTYGSGPGCTEQKIGQFVNDTFIGDKDWKCVQGCGSIIVKVGTVFYSCTAASQKEDWEQGENSFQYTFKDIGPFTISYTGAMWMPLDFGNPNGWVLLTTVDLRTRSDTNSTNASPITASKPMYELQYACYHELQLPMFDPDGDLVKCRWAKGAECDSVCHAVPVADLDEDKCILKFNASNASPYVQDGWYAVALTFEDFPRNDIVVGNEDYNTTTPLSTVPLQFLIHLVGKATPCNWKPVFVTPTPAEGANINIPASKSFSLKIYATNPLNKNEKVTKLSLTRPAGLKFTGPVDDTSRPGVVYWDLTWTPTIRDKGNHIVCAMAKDKTGHSSDTRCITLLAWDLPTDPCDKHPCPGNHTCTRIGSTQKNTCSCPIGYHTVGNNCMTNTTTTISPTTIKTTTIPTTVKPTTIPTTIKTTTLPTTVRTTTSPTTHKPTTMYQTTTKIKQRITTNTPSQTPAVRATTPKPVTGRKTQMFTTHIATKGNSLKPSTSIHMTTANVHCSNLKCKNGGLCDSKGNTGFCLCPSGYSGTLCDISQGNVLTNPKSLLKPTFGDHVIPEKVVCVLHEECSVPLGIISSTNKSSLRPGHIDQGLTTREPTVTPNQQHPGTSMLSLKVVGTSPGQHKACVQTGDSVGNTNDEVCFTVDVKPPGSNLHKIKKTEPYFMDPTITHESVTQCVPGKTCHILMFMSGGVHPQCPSIKQVEGPLADVNLFLSKDHHEIIGNCTADVILTPPVGSSGQQRYCFKIDLPNFPGETRCTYVKYQSIKDPSPTCKGHDCLNGGVCDVVTGQPECICSLLWAGSQCEKAGSTGSSQTGHQPKLTNLLPKVVTCQVGKTCQIPMLVNAGPDKTVMPTVISETFGTSNITKSQPVVTKESKYPEGTYKVTVPVTATTEGKHNVCVSVQSTAEKHCFKVDVSTNSNPIPAATTNGKFVDPSLTPNSTVVCEPASTCHLFVYQKPDGKGQCNAVKGQSIPGGTHILNPTAPNSDGVCETDVVYTPPTGAKSQRICVKAIEDNGNDGETRCFNVDPSMTGDDLVTSQNGEGETPPSCFKSKPVVLFTTFLTILLFALAAGTATLTYILIKTKKQISALNKTSPSFDINAQK